MKKKCILIGTGGQCRVILSIISDEQQAFEPVGILDIDYKDTSETIMDVPVTGGLDLLSEYIDQGISHVFLAIGDCTVREKMYHLVKQHGFSLPNLLSLNSNVSKFSCFGEGNIVCAYANIGPETIIGNNNIINTHANIEHESILGNHSHIAPSAVVAGRVKIGDTTFIGANATIIDKINISGNTTIAAGAVVITDITEPGYIYTGTPATRKKKI